MFLWIFFFLSLYLLIDQALYCRRKRRDWEHREQQIGLGLICALINGIAAFSIQDGGYRYPIELIFAILLMLCSTLVCCRYSFALSLDRLYLHGTLRTLVRLYRLNRQGLLQQLPCKQGQTVYWIDSKSSPPAVHAMQFVTKLNGRYIGTYGRASCLVLVDRIYFSAEEAEKTLSAIRWDLYTGV